MKPITGQIITIMVDDTSFDTIIDENGTQRFIGNPIIRYLLDSHPILTLDDLWHMMDAGLITREHLMDFYAQIGYSVTGFEELFSNSEIYNPAEVQTE